MLRLALSLAGLAPADESDDYVGGVHRLLAPGAITEEIAAHLANIEGNVFAYPPRSLNGIALWRTSCA